MQSKLIGSALVLLLGGALAPLRPAYAHGTFVCWQPNAKTAQAGGADYWTPERRAKAIPDNEVLPRPRTSGRHKFRARKRSRILAAAEPVADVKQPPFKFGGKLFYTRDGSDFEASAQFAADDTILLAAAHSMYKGTGYAKNITFYRVYADGGDKIYTVDQAAVLKAWLPIAKDPPSIGRTASDYAALRTTAASDVGHLTLSQDGSFTNVGMMGYPANLGGGKVMYKQLATKQAQIGSAYDARPNEFGGGASGGAWYVGADDTLRAVSVTSGTAVTGTTLAWGAAFTDTTDAMTAYVKGGCK